MNEQVDVGAILEALRVEVRAQRIAQGHTEPSLIERDLQRSLDEIELTRVVSAHWPLLGKTVPQRIVVLINKLVRRYLRWYINPIVEQQNAYNDAVARTLRLLAEAYTDLAESLEQGTARPEPSVNPGIISGDAAESTKPTATYTELMALVRERAAVEPPARFPDLALHAMEPGLRLRETVNAHWSLTGKTLSQKIIALANKLVRRYLRWYINPIVEQQNAANAAFTRVLLNLILLDAERRAQFARRRAKQHTTNNS